MIPRLLHFVWTGGEPPEWALQNVARFRELNPDWVVRFHGKEVMLAPYYPALARCPRPAQQADVLRLCALRRYGGVYLDADFWPLRPLGHLGALAAADGARLVLSEQHGQHNPDLRLSNAILACHAESPALQAVLEALAARAADPAPVAWPDLGPRLLTDLAAPRPELFSVIPWPWFFPLPVGQTAGPYRRLAAGEPPETVLADRLGQSLGQLPFAVHLWAGGRGYIPEASQERPVRRRLAQVRRSGVSPAADPDRPWSQPAAARDTPAARGPEAAGPRIGVLARAVDVAKPERPFASVLSGLAAIGCQPSTIPPVAYTGLEGLDAVVVWNGRRGPSGRAARRAAEAGVPLLYMEHGFFERRAYNQLDHRGILHWASWFDAVDGPAPAAGAARLAAVWPMPLVPFRRREGYILVLGQLDGDSQLAESPIRRWRDLARAVACAAPGAAVFRPHPRLAHAHSCPLPPAPGPTLAAAVAGAALAVTINSNAGNECLALGCPVLAFGPALYLRAGVAFQANLQTLAADIETMRRGWRPDGDRVANYLRHLACRQWNNAELAQGTVLRRCLAEAWGRDRLSAPSQAAAEAIGRAEAPNCDSSGLVGLAEVAP